MTGILGIDLTANDRGQSDELFAGLMEKVIGWRAKLRQQKQFELADMVRDDLKALGLTLEDGVSGTTWKMT
jgi:cysteinyl-tRNA synthetase